MNEKQTKIIYLKQYMVSEFVSESNTLKPHKIAFILQTCAISAKKDFESKFKLKAGSCMQTADSQFTKNDLETHDFWKEHLNWSIMSEPIVESESQKKYFEIKENAEKTLLKQ